MKYAWVKEHRDEFSVSRMCGLLEVSRSGYCQWRSRGPSERQRSNAVLDAAVSTLHAGSRRSYGRARIVQGLRKQGLQVGHERVRRSLIRQDLRPVHKRPYRVTTDSNHLKPVADNVLDRRFDGWQVNRTWVGDITCVATGEGWLYLALALELASRRIVGWSMSDRMKADLVCDALKLACWRRKPAAGLLQRYATRAQARIDTRAQARIEIVSWIEGFYNRQRLHSFLGYETPVDAECSLKAT